MISETALQDKKILIADSDPVVRSGLARLVAMEDDFHVVGQASDGVEVIEKVRQLNPDVVLIDVAMTPCDGVEATRAIKREWPDVRVIMMTIHSDRVSEAIHAGAEKYFQKDTPPEILFDAIRMC